MQVQRILERSLWARKITLSLQSNLGSNSDGDTPLKRRWTLSIAVALLAVAVGLLSPSLVPDRLFLPLSLDDFPAWRAGQIEERLYEHPAPNRTMSDVLHLFVPGLAVTAAAFDRGVMPLWDPSQGMGVPHLAQIHYGVLYPPAWLPLFFGDRGLALMAVVHILIAGWGTILYLKSLGRSPSAAITGALAFALSAWVTARLHAFPVVGAAVWLPWVLWGLEEGALTGKWAYRGMAAVAVAMSALASFPQITLWVVAFAAIVECVRVLRHLRRKLPWGRPLLASLFAILLGLGLAGPQLLPTTDYLLEESARGGATVESVVADGLEFPLLWHLISPDHYAAAHLDRPDIPHPLAIADLEQAGRPVAINRAETSMGIGLLGLLLAFLALVFGRRWHTRVHVVIAVGIPLLLLSPLLMEWAYTVLPWFRFGNPKRLLLFSSFSLAVLAAGGVDLIRSRRLAVTVTAWVVALIATVLCLFLRFSIPPAQTSEDVDAWASGLAQQLGPEGMSIPDVLEVIPRETFQAAADASADSAGRALLVAVIAIFIFRPSRNRGQEGWTSLARRAPALLAGLLAVELLFSAWPLVQPVSSLRTGTGPLPGRGWNPPAVASEILALSPDSSVPLRVARLGNEPPYLRPNFPGLFGLQDLQCYAPMAPQRVIDLLELVEPGVGLNGSVIGGFTRQESLSSPLIDMVGVSALITDAEVEVAGWEERSRVGHVVILQNSEALPRAWVAPSAELIENKEARLVRLSDPNFRPRETVILSKGDASVEGEGGGEARSVVVDRYQPGILELTVGTGEAGYLVVSETFHRGWRAWVDRTPVEVIPANHALLAVPLKGKREMEVILEYTSPPMLIGAGIAGTSLFTLLLLMVLGRRRQRSSDDSSAPSVG